MKTVYIAILLAFTFTAVAETTPPAKNINQKSVRITPLTVSAKVLRALALVESGNNASAIGDGGKATGAFQMWAAARVDAKSHVPNASCDAELAAAYLDLLGHKLASSLGRSPTLRELYACYNLGFSGFKRRGFNLSNCPAITQKAAVKFEKLANQ